MEKIIKIDEISIKDFYREFGEMIDDFINSNIDIDTLENDVYDEYRKFYDPKVAMIDISKKLDELFSSLSEEGDRCSKCLKILDDEDFIYECNSVPYGEGSVCENIANGYECSKCGYEERF